MRQDYFEKFGHVVEAALVRDKKTQRPRGMAFVSIVPRAQEQCHEGIAWWAGGRRHRRADWSDRRS